MSDLIKKKGLSGSQTKKKWRRNIDVSDLMQDLEKKHTQAFRQEQLKDQPDIVVEDTTRRKREQLDPDRFKRKPVDPKLLSKYEQRKIAKIKVGGAMEVENGEEEVFDAWGSDEPVKTKKQDPKAVRIPSVIPPPGGQSYNPHPQDFTSLVDQIISTQVPIPSVHKPRKRKLIRKHVARARNPKKRLQQLKAIENRKLRQYLHQTTNLKTLAKQVDEEIKKGEETTQRRLKKEEEYRKELESGVIRKGPKLAKQRYTYKQDIDLELQPGALSKQAFRGEVIRDRYDSIFRRGIFEPKKHTVMIQRRKHIKVKKLKLDDV